MEGVTNISGLAKTDTSMDLAEGINKASIFITGKATQVTEEKLLELTKEGAGLKLTGAELEMATTENDDTKLLKFLNRDTSNRFSPDNISSIRTLGKTAQEIGITSDYKGGYKQSELAEQSTKYFAKQFLDKQTKIYIDRIDENLQQGLGKIAKGEDSEFARGNPGEDQLKSLAGKLQTKTTEEISNLLKVQVSDKAKDLPAEYKELANGLSLDTTLTPKQTVERLQSQMKRIHLDRSVNALESVKDAANKTNAEKSLMEQIAAFLKDIPASLNTIAQNLLKLVDGLT